MLAGPARERRARDHFGCLHTPEGARCPTPAAAPEDHVWHPTLMEKSLASTSSTRSLTLFPANAARFDVPPHDATAACGSGRSRGGTGAAAHTINRGGMRSWTALTALTARTARTARTALTARHLGRGRRHGAAAVHCGAAHAPAQATSARITTPHAADGPENAGRGGGQQADIQLAWELRHIAGLTTALPLRRSAAATANRPSAPPACRAPASPPASPPAPAPASASKSRSTGDEWRSRLRSRLHTQCGSTVGVRVAKLWTESMKTTNACVSCCCSITRLPS